ncbi:SulP family inorganic anion transporter [Plantibacter sp. Mn2098]|uniref:SulP family inorganic anion transporter n=1 Tax=Plantibacter sp. Mn2098 TaxID=3395266 RepID=UPI003BE14D82
MIKILPGLHVRNLGREALAGVTLLAIAVPLNIGYAQIAGLPPTAGLYSLILPGIVYALVASTRQMVASPDAAAAALVASSLGGLAAAGGHDYLQLALAQAIIGAGFFGLCALFKLGFLANFLSEPILVGFVGGLALDILVSQAAKMLGISINSGDEFLAKAGELLSGLVKTNLWSLVIAAAAVAILIGGRIIAKRVPWALIVLVVSTIFVVVSGVEQAGVKVLGKIDSGPPVLTWPQLSWGTWLQLAPSAAALTLVAMAEGLLVAKRYGQKHGYTTNPNRDLLAFGAANLASGATGGFTIGSSTSRTAAMDQAGSRTQVPTIVAAIGTLLLVMFGTALLEHVPSPAIGAIVAVAVVPLLGIGDFARLWRERKFEFAVGAVCFLGALLLGPIVGILIAFFLSLINLARRAANPPVDVLTLNDSPTDAAVAGGADTATTAPGVVVLRFAAPLFFANSSVFTDRVTEVLAAGKAHDVRHLVLDCEAITDIDVTGAKSFRTAADAVRSAGVTLHLSRARRDLQRQLTELGLLGIDVYATNRAAVVALTTAPVASAQTSPGRDEARRQAPDQADDQATEGTTP